jgi:hypothetical protein
MPYVITEPESLRRVYELWEDLPPVDPWLSNVRCQKVVSIQKGEQVLETCRVALAPGLHAFIDGNRGGGVGMVLVRVSGKGIAEDEISETPTSVWKVFESSQISGLESAEAITNAIDGLHHILAEVAGLYLAITDAPEGELMTISHDYAGIGAFMRNASDPRHWKARDPIVKSVVSAALQVSEQKSLSLRFYHQRGHTPPIGGSNDLVRFNRRAHELADEGAPKT